MSLPAPTSSFVPPVSSTVPVLAVVASEPCIVVLGPVTSPPVASSAGSSRTSVPQPITAIAMPIARITPAPRVATDAKLPLLADTGIVGPEPQLDPETVPDGAVTEERRSVIPGGALGRYVVLGESGRGGMGRVLRAYDPKLQREVA